MIEVPRRYVPTFERILAIESYIPSCQNILDLGCGDGIYIPFLTRKAEMVVGIDSSLERLKKARNICSFIVLGDAPRLPFRDNAFDVVWASEVIEHLPAFIIFDEIERVASRVIATVPNPAGPILLVDLDHILYMKYTKAILRHFLARRKLRYKIEGLGLCLPIPIPNTIKRAYLKLSRNHLWLAFTLLIRGKTVNQR